VNERATLTISFVMAYTVYLHSELHTIIAWSAYIKIWKMRSFNSNWM